MTTTQTTDRPTAGATATAIPGLFATSPQELSFAPSLEVRAFLLERGEGENILIYNTGHLSEAEDAEALRSRGGVARQYLGHWHEATLGLSSAALGARLLFHSAQAPQVSEHGGSGVSFAFRHDLGDDFEVIPIPGHTAGSTAYLWRTGEHRLLFSADSIYIENGKWRAGLLESSDREAMISSFEQLREVDFDVLVPWPASVGGPYLSVVDEAERIERLDTLIEWLRSRTPR